MKLLHYAISVAALSFVGVSQAALIEYTGTTYLVSTDLTGGMDTGRVELLSQTGDPDSNPNDRTREPIPFFDDMGGTRELLSVSISVDGTWLSYGSITNNDTTMQTVFSAQVSTQVAISQLPNGVDLTGPLNPINPGNNFIFEGQRIYDSDPNTPGPQGQPIAPGASIEFGATGTSCTFTNGEFLLHDPAGAECFLLSTFSEHSTDPPYPFETLIPGMFDEYYDADDPDDLAAFTGTGGFFLEVTTLTLDSKVGGGGNTDFVLDTDLFVDVNVRYEYEEVPSPSPLALMALGLFGIGLARKRLIPVAR